jgi:hypothetical protein
MKRRVYRVRSRGLLGALEKLYESGIRLPAFTVSRTRVAYSAATRRLHVTVRGKRYASISRSGILRPSVKLSKFDLAVIRAVVENPLDVARGAAILLGFDARCPICGRVLDSKDRLRGIGPRCYEKGEFQRLETAKPDHVTKNRSKRNA